jgi:hypothetical protein
MTLFTSYLLARLLADGFFEAALAAGFFEALFAGDLDLAMWLIPKSRVQVLVTVGALP